MIPVPVAMESTNMDLKMEMDEHDGDLMLSFNPYTSSMSNHLPTFHFSPSSSSPTPQSMYACTECSFVCSDNGTFLKHERLHKTERQYRCLVCLQTFTTKANCERHLRKKHSVLLREDIEKFSQVVKPSSAAEDQKLDSLETICKYCGEDFKVERALKHHLRSQSSCQHKPYTCQICSTGFSTKANCLRHIQKQHSHMHPFESHMKVNPELVEVQKRLNGHHNFSGNFEGNPSDLHSGPIFCLMQSAEGYGSPILDLSNPSALENVPSFDEPLDFSFKKGVDTKNDPLQPVEFPVDLSLRKRPAARPPILSGNPLLLSISNKLFPPKTSFVSLKSILKPSLQPTPQASPRPSSEVVGADLKHFNPRTSRYHCPICGAIFKHSSKLQSHLPTHDRAQPSSEFPPQNFSSSSSSSSTSSQLLDKKKIDLNCNNNNDSGQNNNNNTLCKNANMLPISLNNFPDNDLADLQEMSAIVSTMFSSTSPPPSSSSSSSPSLSSSLAVPVESSRFLSQLIKSQSTLGVHDGGVGAIKKGKLKERRGQAGCSAFNQRLKLSMAARKNPYSDSPHKLKCNFCSRAFPWVSSLKRHLLTHTGHKPFKCLKCLVTFSTKSNRERHMMRKHGINVRDQSLRQFYDQSYNCHLCESLPFASLDMLLDHHREMHAHTGTILDIPPPLIIASRDEDEVDHDEEVSANPQRLLAADDNEDENYDEDFNEASPLPPSSSSSSLTLFNNNNIVDPILNMLATSHAKSMNFSINNINIINNNNNLPASKTSQHVNPERDNYNVDKITRCWKCDQSFGCRKGLLRHLKEHNVDLPFKCYLCDASYDARIDSLQHKMSAHPLDWMSVKEKNKVGEDVFKYSDFMEKIVDETLAGNLQGRRIMQQDGLDLDLRPESDYAQRKVFCTLCPKRFWSLQDLRRHMRSHTGERPFECDVCQARFTLKHSMMRHRRKHLSTDSAGNFYLNAINRSNLLPANCIDDSIMDFDEPEDAEAEDENFADLPNHEDQGAPAAYDLDNGDGSEEEHDGLVIDEDNSVRDDAANVESPANPTVEIGS